MPKRRVTTAKQKAASRRNLVKARAARRGSRAVRNARARGDKKLIPHGKTRILFHHTTPAAAKKIRKHGFRVRGDFGRFTSGTVHFTNKRGGAAHIGSAVVKVKLPRKAVISRHTRRFSSGVEWVEVDQKSIPRRRRRA